MIFRKCVSTIATAVDLADKNLQRLANFDRWDYPVQSNLQEIDFRAKFKTMFDGYRKMFGQSFSKSKDLSDMLRFLPGVVVQNDLSLQGMADLYRIEPDLLERLTKSTIEPLRPSYTIHPRYIYKLDNWFLAGPRTISALLLRSYASTYFYLPSIFVFAESIQWLSIWNSVVGFQPHLSSFSQFWRSGSDLVNYVDRHFCGHLYATTTVFLHAQNISEDHPALEILHDLETTSFSVDKNLSFSTLEMAQRIIHVILRWTDMLNCRLKVGVAYVLWFPFSETPS